MSKEVGIIIVIALTFLMVGGSAWQIDSLKLEIKLLKMRVDFLESRLRGKDD